MMMGFVSECEENKVGKGKMLVASIFFPTMISKGISAGVFQSRDCAVKSERLLQYTEEQVENMDYQYFLVYP